MIPLPTPSESADLKVVWPFLEEGISRIMCNASLYSLPYVRYMSLYTVAYNIVTSSENPDGPMDGARELYDNLIRYFVAHVKILRDPSDALQDESLLRFYVAKWDHYTLGATYTDRLFTLLNRWWVKRERDEGRKGTYPVYTVALVQWCQNFFLYFQSKHAKLVNAVLRLIELQRNGEMIDQGLIKKVVDSFVSLGVDPLNTNMICLDIYKGHFEGPFIEATENYYKKESDSFLAENNISDYLRLAEERLKEEEDRIERYLNTETRKALISTCEHVLIHRHSELMWESFQSLLDADKEEDLQRMYALLSRIPEGLEPLQKTFEEHVKKVGLAAVSKHVGEGGANVDAPEPKAYVDALLEVHKKCSETILRSFGGEAGFVTSLDKACKEFVNWNAATGTSSTKSPELLAKHADMLLRKSNKMGEEVLEKALNGVMTLFEYIQDKDVFHTFYATKLSKRFIQSLSASDEAEASMITKLKGACGFEYTNKLQHMFTDMRLSKDITDQFKERMTIDQDEMNVTFSIMVLGTNFWPMSAPHDDFIIPAEILPTYDQFQKYYQNRHPGRKLTWLWNYSKNKLQTNYWNEKYVLMTSTYQTAVLLQYNNNDTLSLEELVAATAINKESLAQVLSLLTKAKVLINRETDQYDLNPSFKSKKIRVNLNLPTKAELETELSSVLKTLDQNRKYTIQTTIVRIMKSRQTMKNQELLLEVVLQISKQFAPKIRDITRAIETLLEEGYIERVEWTADTFAYAT